MPKFERREARNQLISTSNLEFCQTLENAPVPVVLHAEDGTFFMISNICLELLGYEYCEINSFDKWMTLLHRDRKEYNMEFVDKIWNKEKQEKIEVEAVYTKNNNKLFWEFHNSIVGTLTDGRKLMMTVCIDVTDRVNNKRKREAIYQELKKSQTLLNASLESHKEMIMLAIDTEYNYYNYNSYHKKSMKEIYGVDIEIGSNLLEAVTVEEDRKKVKYYYDRALNGEYFSNIDTYGEDGDMFYQTNYSPIKDSDGNIIGAAVIASNITSKIHEQHRIEESEKNFRMLYSSMAQGLAIHKIIVDENNNPIDYIVLDINDSYQKLFGIEHDKLIGSTIKTHFPELEDKWINNFGKVALTGEPSYYEDYSVAVDKYLSTYSYSLGEGKFAVLISDITQRVERTKEIEYLSYYDQLTGLYNRHYYEQQFEILNKPEFLPLSIIMGDVNGLKLVNDSFGHATGDKLLKKVASILKDSCRESDIITRIGGDEFVIFLPNTTEEVAHKIIDRIQLHAKQSKIESLDISISFGHGTKTKQNQSLEKILKQIEDDMYRIKLFEGSSMRNKTVDLIMTTLYEKNEREMNHSLRVSSLCEMLAQEVGLESEQVLQAKTGGLLHDIGKIGINESILDKEGSLTSEELAQVHKHSEIGYRILSSVNDLSDIANHILMHHEHWNGLGYPKGLKGEEISLLARIIHICDAYDAMTGPRPYREPLSREEALEELKRCKGTQFDPHLVDVFIEKILP